MSQYYCYIIESVASKKWYYGSSQDVDSRVKFHNLGFNKSTDKRGPWKLIFIRAFDDKGEALAFERHLKALRNKAYIRRAYSEYFVRSSA